MNIIFEQVKTEKQIKILANTANVVWHEAYKEIIAVSQIDYMIEKFQSFNPLFEAINKNNYLYYLIKADTLPGHVLLHNY